MHNRLEQISSKSVNLEIFLKLKGIITLVITLKKLPNLNLNFLIYKMSWDVNAIYESAC